MTAPLIPEVFPFTAEEVRDAVRRWQPADRVDQMVELLVAEAGQSIERHAKLVEQLGGNAGEYGPDFSAPDELLAYLTLVSPSAATRVNAIIERRWAKLRARELENETRWAAVRDGIIPNIDDVLDDMERRGEFSWDDPVVFRGLVVSGLREPPLPEPTPAVIAAAEAHVAEDIDRWEALLAAVRTGAPLPPKEPNSIWDDDEALPEDALPSPEPDWQFIDDYIQRQDRKALGERRLFGGIARDLPRFNGELARALRLAPEKAVPRAVVYQLVCGHVSALLVTSRVGAACEKAFAASGPPRTMQGTEEYYLPADLLDWYEANRTRYEAYPLFDEWRSRKRTRREVSFMRLVRDRYDELFPEEPDDEADAEAS